MGQAVLHIAALPDGATEAARAFYSLHLPAISKALADVQAALVLVLPPASYDHDGWRRAAVRDLARAHAPRRINMVAGVPGSALDTTLAYLDRAPGVTGQLFDVDGQGRPDQA